MTLKTGQRMSLAAVEQKARQMIQAACPPDLMDVVSLATDRENGFVYIVLRCRQGSISRGREDDQDGAK